MIKVDEILAVLLYMTAAASTCFFAASSILFIGLKYGVVAFLFAAPSITVVGVLCVRYIRDHMFR